MRWGKKEKGAEALLRNPGKAKIPFMDAFLFL
jgi:hypothetical protein